MIGSRLDPVPPINNMKHLTSRMHKIDKGISRVILYEGNEILIFIHSKNTKWIPNIRVNQRKNFIWSYLWNKKYCSHVFATSKHYKIESRITCWSISQNNCLKTKNETCASLSCHLMINYWKVFLFIFCFITKVKATATLTGSVYNPSETKKIPILQHFYKSYITQRFTVNVSSQISSLVISLTD